MTSFDLDLHSFDATEKSSHCCPQIRWIRVQCASYSSQAADLLMPVRAQAFFWTHVQRCVGRSSWIITDSDGHTKGPKALRCWIVNAAWGRARYADGDASAVSANAISPYVIEPARHLEVAQEDEGTFMARLCRCWFISLRAGGGCGRQVGHIVASEVLPELAISLSHKTFRMELGTPEMV